MKNPLHASVVPCLAAFSAALLLSQLTGCAGNSPQARAEHTPTFAALPARDQQLALAGQVRAGMSPEAVAVAWGQPTQVFQGKAGERRLLAWVYLRAAPVRAGADFGNYPADYAAARLDFLSAYYRGDRLYNNPGTYFSRFYPGAVFYPGPMGGSIASEQPILVKQAVFESGRLARFVELQEPAVR